MRVKARWARDGKDAGVWMFPVMPRIGETVRLPGAPEEYRVSGVAYEPVGAAMGWTAERPGLPEVFLV